MHLNHDQIRVVADGLALAYAFLSGIEPSPDLERAKNAVREVMAEKTFPLISQPPQADHA